MHSFYLPPGNLDLITVTGPDAAKLLQGQLTCDIDAVPDPGFTRGALCNNKGRVFATFVLVRQGVVFHLVLNKGLGATLKAALKKYLPFYKCELRDAGADEICVGACGDISASALCARYPVLPAAGQCANVDGGWICALGVKHYLLHSRVATEPPPDLAVGTLDQWLLCELLSGQFPFLPEDAEKYTPQEMHLDRHGYVSFTKGCYTGQEIVARMHYRGKNKKQLFLLQAPLAENSPSTPMEILDANDQVLGSTIKTLFRDGTLYALAPLPAEPEESKPGPLKNRAGVQLDRRAF